MGTKLEDEDYDTLGGFLYAQLDKIPNVADTITFKDMTFTVLSTRGRRITQVRVERNLKPEAASQEEEPHQPLLMPLSEQPSEASDNSPHRQRDPLQSPQQPSHY